MEADINKPIFEVAESVNPWTVFLEICKPETPGKNPFIIWTFLKKADSEVQGVQIKHGLFQPYSTELISKGKFPKYRSILSAAIL